MFRASRFFRTAPSSTPFSFTASHLVGHKRAMQQRLAAQQARLAVLSTEKQRIDAKAFAKAKACAWAGAAYLAAQTSTLFVWTYDTFDWNLVEPITFLLGYGVVWLSVAMYIATGRDFTYTDVREIIISRATERLYSQNGFSIEEYRRVETDVKELSEAIEGLAAVEVDGQ